MRGEPYTMLILAEAMMYEDDETVVVVEAEGGRYMEIVGHHGHVDALKNRRLVLETRFVDESKEPTTNEGDA